MKKWFFDAYGLRMRWIPVIILTGLFCFMWAANAFLIAPSCARTADLYELEHDYSFLTGCNVLVDGQYRNIENVRVYVETP